MGRFIKIVLYIFLAVFAYLWLSTMIKSCNNPVPDSIIVGTDDTTELKADETKEEFFEDGETVSEDENYDFDHSEEDEINYDDVDKTLENTDNSTNSNGEVNYDSSPPVKQPSYTSNSGSSSGRFLVITGSYLVRSNAENMTSKLSDMGYSDSEVVVFDGSQYNSVVASRYGSYNSALDAVNELKRRGIDAYVHRKK